MRSCMISLVLMSICCAQGQSSFAGSLASNGTGGPGSQFQRGYGRYRGSHYPVQAISRDPYSSSSTSVVTSEIGYNDNGEKYDRYTVENVIENTLYRAENIRWPSLGIVNDFRYTLDLSDPHATPVWDRVTTPSDIRTYQPAHYAMSSAGRYWYNSAERFWCYMPFLLFHFVKF